MLSDSTIWNDFREGKSYALSYIYCCNVEHLIQYGRKFTRDEALVKDTIQEVFYTLIRSRATLGETTNIRFYLMAAFKHNIVRGLHAEKRQGAVDNPELPYELNITYSLEDEYIDKETDEYRLQLIRKVLGTITPKQREILYYRYSCDFSYDEICLLMSIKYDSARKMVFRALKSLREHLEPADFIFLFIPQKRV